MGTVLSQLSPAALGSRSAAAVLGSLVPPEGGHPVEDPSVQTGK